MLLETTNWSVIVILIRGLKPSLFTDLPAWCFLQRWAIQVHRVKVSTKEFSVKSHGHWVLNWVVETKSCSRLLFYGAELPTSGCLSGDVTDSAVASLASSLTMSLKRLSLKATVTLEPQQNLSCFWSPTVNIILTFINTAPPCDHQNLIKMCFPEKDASPHIKENRWSGPFRQLRRLTYQDLCPNFTITYSLEAGIPSCIISVALMRLANQIRLFNDEQSLCK